MSKNYDNWERLVTAVSRRERDRRIALSHSRDPSSISSTPSSNFDLSFSSTSQLPMDYSDLTLDHDEWKAILPPGKHEVIWRSTSQSFSLDKRSGKNCFLLGAGSLVTSAGGGEAHLFVIMKSHPQSRFSEVIELKYPRLLCIQARIIKGMLSPETLYAAYLVFKCGAGNYKYEEYYSSAVSAIGVLYGESHIVCEYFFLEMCFKLWRAREDGWMEIELGDFYVGVGDNKEVLVVQVNNFRGGGWSTGITIEGIEFRPFNGKKRNIGQMSTLRLD